MTRPSTFPPNHYAVQFTGGSLDGRVLPIYDKVYDHEGWRHGVPSKNETAHGGVIWSYAHRWPTACPRYVLTADAFGTLTAEWRPITDAEFDEGQHLEARWRHWEKVLYPLEYTADVAFFARKRAEDRGVSDPKELYRITAAAVEAVRDREPHALGSWTAGEKIPDGVQYLCDVRGNMQVRLIEGRQQWFQPAPDRYTAYPDRHVWVPRVRLTSALLAKGPLTLVTHDLVTPEDRFKLDHLADVALEHLAARSAEEDRAAETVDA